MKIHFEDQNGWCLTPCPYGFTNGYTGKPKTVGSNSCSDCKHFVDIDTENDTIECDYKN